MNFLPFYLLLGWVAGALVNYLADVLPVQRRLAPPSCRQCRQPLSSLNYWLWPRRCPACGQARSPRTWLVEGAALAVAFWLWSTPPVTMPAWVAGILLTYFGVIVVIDVEHRLIMHPVSLVGAVGGIAIGASLHGIVPTLLGGVAGFGFMFLVYFLGFLWVRWLSRGRAAEALAGEDEAMGFGDVNLSGVLGFVLGWPGIGVGLFLAILLGGAASLVFILVMLLRRRYRVLQAIPYGPFLVAGAVLTLFFRDAIWAGYFNLF